MYKQCKLEKTSDSGKLTRVTYIEVGSAKPNKRVMLIEDDDTESGPWVVVEAYGEPVKREILDRQRKAQKNWFSDQELSNKAK